VEPLKAQLKLRDITSATERGKIKLGEWRRKDEDVFISTALSNIKQQRIDR
jgi:hypothetical protein